MLQEINNTADFLKQQLNHLPQVGIVLGSGLGALADQIAADLVLDYSEIPGFPVSTVEGHAGKLIFGRLGGKYVVAMQGRFHYYEGYGMNKVVFPIRVMKMLGIEYLLLSNACGGVNETYEIGDLMLLTDHINLFGDNPLMGPNMDELGPRFPDMSEAYDKALLQKATAVAEEKGIKVQQGVYAGVSGPCLETPAEYKYIRIIGADVVGMSTVPEVIAARHMGIPCFACSIVSDLGVEGKIVEVTHTHVQEVANKAEPLMTQLFTGLIERL